jgi:hypothetical protein
MTRVNECVVNLSYNYDLHGQNSDTCNKLSRVVNKTSCLISADLCKKLVQAIKGLSGDGLDQSDTDEWAALKTKLILDHAAKFEIF